MGKYGIERCHHRRYGANFTIFHVGQRQAGRAYTRDISEGGAFVETQTRLKLGTPLDIELFLDLGDEVESMSAKAEVAWCAPAGSRMLNGMGIRFVSMDDDSRQTLRRAIARLQAAEVEIDG